MNRLFFEVNKQIYDSCNTYVSLLINRRLEISRTYTCEGDTHLSPLCKQCEFYQQATDTKK